MQSSLPILPIMLRRYIINYTCGLYVVNQETNILILTVTRRMPLVEQELLTIPEFTHSLLWGSCCSILSFLCNVWQITVVLFLLVMVLSVVLWLLIQYLQTSLMLYTHVYHNAMNPERIECFLLSAQNDYPKHVYERHNQMQKSS